MVNVMELEKLSLKNVDFYQATIANIPEKKLQQAIVLKQLFIFKIIHRLFFDVLKSMDCPYMLGTS